MRKLTPFLPCLPASKTPGKVPGDVIFVVRQKSEDPSGFTRHGNDLEISHKITLEQALLGFSAEIKHLDGHTVRTNSTMVERSRQHANTPHRKAAAVLCRVCTYD